MASSPETTAPLCAHTGQSCTSATCRAECAGADVPMSGRAQQSTGLDAACAVWWGSITWALMPDDEAAMMEHQRDREEAGRLEDAWTTHKAEQRELMRRAVAAMEPASHG